LPTDTLGDDVLQLPCPWCGPRDQSEFLHRGEFVVRPDAAVASDEEWIDYLYYRGNVRGWQREYWVHIHGCQQLFVIRRHTLTHDIEPLP
jgi:sarcosine oxidase, subunit delta